MLDFVIFAVTFLSALILAIIWLYPSSQKVTTVPGLDPSSKEDGNLSDIERAGSVHEFLLDLHEQFGSIAGFWWGKTYVVSIASPELFKEHQNVFDKPSKLFEIVRPIVGPASIQYANGSDGRARRRNYDKAFPSELSPKYCSWFQKVADSVEEKWMKIGPEDHVPLTEHTCSYAFKTTLCALLGDFEDESLITKMKSAYEKAWLEIQPYLMDLVTPDEDSPAGKQIRSGLYIIPLSQDGLFVFVSCICLRRQSVGTTVPLLPKVIGVKRLAAISVLDKAYMGTMGVVHSTLKEVVAAHKKRGQKDAGNKLIDILVETCPDETTLLSDAVTYINVGFQSSWNVLSWAFYFLATHKDAQDKLYKEIKSILGQTGTVNESNFSEFKYMIQVIDETLRCAVVSPWTARVQDFDSELGGHKIPKNTPVIQALGVVMQDKKIWSLPNKFDPERFNEENLNDKPPHSFPAFGFAGKRKCPAHKFAYWEAAVLLATLIRRFEVSLWNDQLVQPIHELVSRPAEEIWIKVVKR